MGANMSWVQYFPTLKSVNENDDIKKVVKDLKKDLSLVINVKDFGAISSASIEVGGLTLLLGDNDSGKTSQMKLLAEILRVLPDVYAFDEYCTGKEFPSIITKDNYFEIESVINKWLDKNKDNIVKSAFNIQIPLKELSIRIKSTTAKFSLRSLSHEEIISRHSNKIKGATSGFEFVWNNISTDIFSDSDMSFVNTFVHGILNCVLYEKRNSVIFIPSSRSGFELFYMNPWPLLIEGKAKELFGQDSLPYIKQYLMFIDHLNTDLDNHSREMLDFVKEKIVDRDFKINDIIYMNYRRNCDKPSLENTHSFSSSSINKSLPFLALIADELRHQYVFFDEVEMGFHPLKQIELARLLVRLINYGYHMVISTHSDTLAAAINNLVMLSFAEKREEKAKKIGYTKNDLFDSNNIHVYQFIRKDDIIEVEELECYYEQGIGYDFDLFYDSNTRLYKEAKIITGEDI